MRTLITTTLVVAGVLTLCAIPLGALVEQEHQKVAAAIKAFGKDCHDYLEGGESESQISKCATEREAIGGSLASLVVDIGAELDFLGDGEPDSESCAAR